MAKLTKWPFRPIHITNDGEKAPLGSPLRQLTSEGIISNAHLRGLETTMCANLGYPNTIIEFSPEGEPVRTDSPLLDAAQPPFGLHPPCKILRKRAGKKWCYECDNIHALLFHGITKSNLDTKIPRRIAGSTYIQKYLASDPEVEFAFKKQSGRGYLSYDCPLLGSRELVFPIFFEDRVIGTYFTGQIYLKREKGIHQQKDHAILQ